MTDAKINSVYLVRLVNNHWEREYYVIASDEIEAGRLAQKKHPSFVGTVYIDMHYMNVSEPGILL
jgi:hypothetical protein